ncbi:MAG: hypothetical protein AB7R89_24165 [Dehalococcoidia bacterium]
MIGALFSLLYLVLAGAFGVAVLRRATSRLFGSLEQLSYGAPLGIALTTLILLLLSFAMGLSTATVVIAGVISLGGTIALLRTGEPLRLDRPREWTRTQGGLLRIGLQTIRCHVGLLPLVVLTALIALWSSFYLGMTFVRDGDLWASQIHIWSDISVHLGQVTAFAYGDNFPPRNPFYAGEPFTYHYLISLTTAAMVELGMSPLSAIKLHDLILMTLATLATFAFARRLIGNGNAAALATALFFLGSGLGWLVTAAEVNRSHDITGTLLDRAWDYGAVAGSGIRWEPVFLVAIAPTRGTLYGLSLGLLVLALLFHAIQRSDRRAFLLAGAVAGFLPLAHMGTLLALAMIAPFLFLLFPSRGWLYFFAPWVAIAVPQLILQGGLGGGADRVHRDFGWMADKENALWFWLINLGLFLPLLLFALFDRASTTRVARRFLWAFMPIFVVANAVALDPTGPWNNLKVLFYWFLAVCILVAALLVRTWQEHRTLMVRALLAGCALTMLLSGLLMHLHVARGKNAYMVFSRAEIDLARQVRERTSPDAVFVSGLQYNPVITALAGRSTLIFFPPYLQSWGIDTGMRERDVRSIYALTPNAIDLLRQYNVSYVLIGPSERNTLHANVEGFRSRFPVVAATEGHEVFDVRVLPDQPLADPATTPSSGEVAYPNRSEGECITAISGGTAYYLEGGYRRPIPDDETRRSLGCDVVWPWGDQEVSRIPEGPPVPPAR